MFFVQLQALFSFSYRLNFRGIPIIDVSLGVDGVAGVADGVAKATPPAAPATPTRIWATPLPPHGHPLSTPENEGWTGWPWGGKGHPDCV